MMKLFSLRIITAVLITVLGFSGCATHRVTTDAYTADAQVEMNFSPGAAFYVEPNNDVPNPIFDHIVKDKIEMILKHHGYNISSSEKADYILKYGYALQGREVVEYDIWPKTRYNFIGSLGHSHNYYDHRPFYSTIVADTYPAYIAFLRLSIFASHGKRTEPKLPALWIGETSTESRERDLRNMIDYMIVGSLSLLGQDTEKPKEIKVDEDDPALKLLKTYQQTSAKES